MSLINQLKILLWKNYKIFWKERLKLIFLFSINIISIIYICTIGNIIYNIIYKYKIYTHHYIYNI